MKTKVIYFTLNKPLKEQQIPGKSLLSWVLPVRRVAMLRSGMIMLHNGAVILHSLMLTQAQLIYSNITLHRHKIKRQPHGLSFCCTSVISLLTASLLCHRHLELVLRINKMIVVVFACVEPYPVDVTGKGIALRAVVRRCR